MSVHYMLDIVSHALVFFITLVMFLIYTGGNGGSFNLAS